MPTPGNFMAVIAAYEGLRAAGCVCTPAGQSPLCPLHSERVVEYVHPDRFDLALSRLRGAVDIESEPAFRIVDERDEESERLKAKIAAAWDTIHTDLIALARTSS